MQYLEYNRNAKKLPDNIPPTSERRGLCVSVPNDPEYIGLFLGAVFELTKQYIYDRDPLHKAREVAAVWLDVFFDLQSKVIEGADCVPFPIAEEGCTNFLPSDPRILYSPNDPFSTPNFIPPGYLVPPFYTNPLVPLPGVQPGDAMVNFLSLPVGMTLPELIAIGYPRIRIPIVGIGEVELEMVRVPQGGICIINQDDDPNTYKVLDLNSVEILGLPELEDILEVVLDPYLQGTETVEIEFNTPGNHFIDIQFLPNIGEDVILGFGGGLRRVGVCENAQIGDVPVPEFRITGCDLEWRPNNLAAWSNLGNVCGEDGAPGAPGASGEDGTPGTNGTDGRTPEFMSSTDAEGMEILWKYTDEGIGLWRSLGTLEHGEDGINANEQIIRQVTVSATRKCLEWKFVSDPDVPGIWRTIGCYDIPTNADCGCDDVPEPTEIDANPDRCRIAWGLGVRVLEEIARQFFAFGTQYAAPYTDGNYYAHTFEWLEQEHIFLSHFLSVRNMMDSAWSGITDATDAQAYENELLDFDNGHIVAEAIYSFYNPLTPFTSTHAALIASYLTTIGLSNRAVMSAALWFNAVNVSHIQDYIYDSMSDTDVVDCNDFSVVGSAVMRSIEFDVASAEEFEDEPNLIVQTELTIPTSPLGTLTKVYYEAIDGSAINGVHYNLPPGWIQYLATAVNGNKIPIVIPLIDNTVQDGNKSFTLKLTSVDNPAVIIGNQNTMQITIKDNEDFYLVIDQFGTNLQRIGDFTWSADSVLNATTHRLYFRSMNNDINRCFKLVSVTFPGINPATKQYFNCGSGAVSNGVPVLGVQDLNGLRYSSTAGAFSAIVEILPA